MAHEASFFEIEKKDSPEKYARWHHRLLSTLLWRENTAYNASKNWNIYLDMDKGKHWSASLDSEDAKTSDNPGRFVTVNKTTSTIESFAAFYLRRLPEFMVTQTIPGEERAVSAENQTKILNYYWRELKIQAQFKKALRFFLTVGHGIIKTGFERDLNPGTKEVDGKIVTNDYIRKENPWATCVDPRRFLFSSDAEDYTLGTSRWCAEMFIEPIQDILINEAYSKSVRQNIMSGKQTFDSALSVMNQFSINSTKEQKEQFNRLSSQQLKSENLAIKWEIWDKKFDERIILLQGCEFPLFTEDNPTSHLDGFPYIMFKFMPDLPVHYSPGIPFLIRWQQVEADRVRTKQFNHHRKVSRKYAVNTNYVNKSELIKLQTGETEYIPHDDPTGQPIQAIPDIPMSIDTDRVINIINADWAEVTGSDALSRSGSLPSRTTATEINSRENFFGVKAEAKSDIVNEALVDTGTQILQHIQRFSKADIIGVILGGQFTSPVFLNVSPEQIKGEFGLKVSSVSAEVIDPLLDRAQSVELVKLFMGNLPLIAQNPILALPFSWLAKKINAVGADQWLDPILAGLLPKDAGNTVDQDNSNAPSQNVNTASQPASSAQSRNTQQPENEILGALLGGG